MCFQTWLDPATPPSAALAKCKICRDLMVLILQLNAELPDHFPGHDRRLYVLTCRRKACRRKEGSIRVLRGVRLSEAAVKDSRKTDNNKASTKQLSNPIAQSKVVSDTAFGDGLFGAKSKPNSGSTNLFSNPFSTTPAGNKSANPFSTSSATSNLPPLSDLAAKPSQTPVSELPKTFASALTLNNDQPSVASTYGPPPPPEPWPEESALPIPYPLFYLVDADYEILDKVVDDVPQAKIMDIDEGAGSSSGGGGGEDKDAYESTHDKTFQAFADRMAQNPEQVIRYEFRGSPLLYSKSDAVGKLLSPQGHGSEKVAMTYGSHNRIPRCASCGAARIFEVQVTPHAILELESDEMSLEGMDWGTIIVGVCEHDCTPRGTAVGEVAYLEEWAGVQWEELHERRARA